MKRSSWIKSIAIPAALTLALVGCASEPDDEGADTGDTGDTDTEDTGDADDTDDEGDDEEAAGEEGGELTVALGADIVSLDPHGSNDVPSSNVQVNIYETLVTQTEDMEIEPLLATEWEALEDDLWEFTLRDDVTFHDGSEFNADVVVANFERVLDEDIASPRAFLFEMVEEVTAVDDYTVQIKTEYPFAPLPSHLAHSGGAMISGEAIEEDYAAMEDGDEPGTYINNNSSGSGYFMLEERTSGDNTVLVKNEDYWGENAKVDQVTFRVIGDPGQMVNSVEAGEIDIAYPIRPTDRNRVEGNDSVELYEQESLSTAYIGFNNDKEPYDDPTVRRALAMAIDKEAIIDGVLDGAAEPAIGPIGEQVFGFDDSIEDLPYDPDQARELLEEAGYGDGFETTIWTNDSAERQDIAIIVQSQLEEIGVDVEIEVLEWGAYLDETAAGNHDMFILGWVTVTGDADYGMFPLFHSSQHGAAGNRTFTANDELDEILDAARRETDEDTRQELYSEAMEILVDDAPMLYLYHTTYLVGLGENVGGFWKHPNGLFMLQDVTVQ
ncbi:glutathione ABC transporter substrate-binding protein [Alteribacter lacisalsi]|uniref:Glutathione ABC transporter substrate-binding protein n=1 Tax=Alteribacter lacisalsi TaxID=2045244 RepID=A0A2W0H4U4_9BACI|nr:glutathione ABC transporter substrate-binding protein [Alteribacter lacisalsi]PYZ96041.1 glutathione ABC transporter substrate-binding protein [Alteribacter lacisalsi]